MDRIRRRPKKPTISTEALRDPSSNSAVTAVAVVGAASPAVADRDSSKPTDKPQKTPRIAAFRALHLKKRTRSPAPTAAGADGGATTPKSPSHAAVAVGQDGIEHHTRSSLSRQEFRPERKGSGRSRTPKMPTFLTQSSDDLESKWQDITWAERNRVAQGNAAASDPNGNAEHKWGHYTGSSGRTGGGGDNGNNGGKPPMPVMDRYYNIKPWNHNRIRLRVPATAHDYVNASPIVLTSPSDPGRPPLRYIAMQGPTEASLDSVWRMVAEQLGAGPVVIVQLTNMVENGMQKCFPYFPQGHATPATTTGPAGTGNGSRSTGDGNETAAVVAGRHWELNEADAWGDGWKATLRFEELRTLESGAIEVRKMRLRVAGDHDKGEGAHGEGRVVWHLLYTRWPDFGVPALEDLGSFFALMRLSRELNGGSGSGEPQQARIVHCSAGVGRTGTFITLEHVMRELEVGYLDDDYDTRVGEGADLIYETVEALREQRKSMVQAETQFRFLYEVVRKLWVEKYGALAGEEEDTQGEPAAKRLEVVVGE